MGWKEETKKVHKDLCLYQATTCSDMSKAWIRRPEIYSLLESSRAPEPVTKNAINVGEPKNLEEVSDGIFDKFKQDSQDI